MTGHNRLLDIALELERIALEDEYFISRKLTRTSIFIPASSIRPWFAGDNVSGDVRHSAHRGLAGAMAGDDHRSRAKDHASAPNLVGQPRRELPKQQT